MQRNSPGQYRIGLLHPGNMGACVAATLLNSGHLLYWVSENRSSDTRRRATQLGMQDLPALEDLCSEAEVIFSVCPPHAAEHVCDEVIRLGYRGTYVDANAVSPQRCVRMAERVEAAGAVFVDGGIIGLPTVKRGETWMHLSGGRAGDIAALFSAGPMETSVVGPDPGQASALKMCYAAYRKGTTALIAAVMAAAEALQVRGHLEQQWQAHWPGFVEESHSRVTSVTAKAWRFTAEMQEIAATFEYAGQPGGFHKAAEQVYERMACFRDAAVQPSLDEVLGTLSHPDH